MRYPRNYLTGCLLAALALSWGQAAARGVRASARPLASNLIVPQRRVFAVNRRRAVQITEVNVGVAILEQAATTTMDIGLRNPTGSRLEAELLVAVPDGAVVRSFAYQGASSEPTAQVLPKKEARQTYNAIVARLRDPALLEFVGYNLIRSSVFPVPPRGRQKVRLTYERLLPAHGNRIDYVLPRTESVDYRIPWRVTVQIKSKRPVSTVYSPTHKVATKRLGRNVVSVRMADEARTEPGPFRLSYLLEQNGVTASLFAYPAPQVDGGYFLLLAGLPASLPRGRNAPAIRREVTIVLDRSGSMSGRKLRQVREAARQIVGGLDPGETFNIIVYNETVDAFSRRPVPKTPLTEVAAIVFLERLRARGGTNIHDALVTALRQKPARGVLPVVLFLTDGLPTVGQTSEVAIREVATKANRYKRRLFTFGVGVDVNTPLLERIALETRATATFVLPGENVERKVAGVFRRLAGPMLADATLQPLGPDGEPAPSRVQDVIPSRLPDLFVGDQLVVLGHYIGEQPLAFEVSGNYLGRKRSFRFRFPLDKATTRNAFVPRLWASRKIATLVDAIRARGANGAPATVQAAVAADPGLKELVDEVVRLSTEFGILTEYTAFLASEGTDLTQRDTVLSQVTSNFVSRAYRVRRGLDSLNQDINRRFQRGQLALNFRNTYWDPGMNRVAITTVQQVNDRAFYRRGRRWVDSRVINQGLTMEPATVIEFGSEAFRKLAARLAGEGRQGCIALQGDIVLVVDGQPVLIKGPAASQVAK